ncbi:MAG: hypothetical protein R3176_04025, partial [Woeseiaceae bacterium]|nr:hypothetical protein [Woeseiaceae bacterium]
MTLRHACALWLAAGLAACAAPEQRHGTLAELEAMPADVDEVYLADSLERAAASYRRYLDETPESARTPEAMRRLADLQIEQAYGVIGQDDLVEMAAPETGAVVAPAAAASGRGEPAGSGESDAEFEARATARATLLADTGDADLALTGVDGEPIPAGPREAIKT